MEQTKLAQPRSDADVTTPFYKMRSEVIDIFAIAETEITKYIIAHSSKPPCLTVPMAQKIDLALKVAAGPQRSKAIKQNADLKLQGIRDLLIARAAIVHSSMTLAKCFPGGFIAIFQNAKDIAAKSPQAFVFSENDFHLLIENLKLSTNNLIAALAAKNQPNASVKPPKPAK